MPAFEYQCPLKHEQLLGGDGMGLDVKADSDPARQRYFGHFSAADTRRRDGPANVAGFGIGPNGLLFAR